MVRKWVVLVNYSACGIIAVLLLASLYFVAIRQRSFPISDTVVKKLTIPKGSFRRTPDEYQSISSPALQLRFSPLSVQLPDLRRYLVYYGKNGRPDAQEDKLTLFFSFTGNKSPTPVFPEKRSYILYDKKISPNQYIFSPNNEPTDLWVTAKTQANQAVVNVWMDGGNGLVISEPTSYAEFMLPEKEFARFGSQNSWELGKFRVDGTLLARQKAKWYGVDKFLEEHGGEEYKALISKQRIDFGEGDDVYSVYVGLGDCLIWNDGRWKSVKPGTASLKNVLMCVKKIDERSMNLELWDIDGKGKVSLNLIRANEPWVPKNLEQNFKFLGARTRSQFVFEVNKERMLLSPHDWLLFSDSVWKKLSSPKDIDDYVERKKVGPLFVFDRVERKEDQQVVVGYFFNAARSEMVAVEFPLQQNGGTKAKTKRKASGPEKKQKTQESNQSPVVKSGTERTEGLPGAPQIRPYSREEEQGRYERDDDDDEEDDNNDD